MTSFSVSRMIPWPFSLGRGAIGFKQLAAVSSKGQSRLLLYYWHRHPRPVCLLKRTATLQARRVGDLEISVSLSDTWASEESSRTAVSEPGYRPAAQNKSHLALSLVHSQEESGMGAMDKATFF